MSCFNSHSKAQRPRQLRAQGELGKPLGKMELGLSLAWSSVTGLTWACLQLAPVSSSLEITDFPLGGL